MARVIDGFGEALDDFADPHLRCFLCGRDVSGDDATVEHVVPKWAQHRYGLWDQSMVLLNRTPLRYRYLTVPCCFDCNNLRLRPIEDAVSEAVESGREATVALGPKTLFLWLGKLFFGVLYKELILLYDRSNPGAGTILDEDFLRHYRTHRFFLQQARGVVELKDFNPGTIFVFDAQRLDDARLCWDMIDSVPHLMIGVRVGRVAIVGALADGGAQADDEEVYGRFYGLPLHPMQFRELCARVAYRASTATRTPKYITIGDSPQHTIQMPLGGLSAKPLFTEWTPSEYAHFFSYFTGCPYSEAFCPPNLLRTYLETPDGKVSYMSFRDIPMLPEEPKG